MLAAFASERAGDADVRAAMKRVAAEEARHAELSWSLHAWALSSLEASERALVLSQMEEERRALHGALGEESAWGMRVGLPTSADAKRIVRELDALLFAA